MACSWLFALCSDVHHSRRSRSDGHKKRRMAHLRRRSWKHSLCAARSDQREQLRQAAGCVAIQDRCLRHQAGFQSPDNAPDDQRRALCHGRPQTRRRCDRRRDGRAAVDVPDRRRQARGRGATPVVRARGRVLDGWERRRAHLHGDDRVSARRARGEDRDSGPRVRPERDPRSQAEQRPGPRSDHGRNRIEHGTDCGQGRGDRGSGASSRRRAAEQDERERVYPRVRRQDRKAAVDLPHDSAAGRVRQRDLGEGLLVVFGQRRHVGPVLRG